MKMEEMMKPRFVSAIALAALVACAVANNPGVAAEIHGAVHSSPAVILQVLKEFDNPEGAIFSADGSHVFVSNAAEAGNLSEKFGWVEGAGYISKLDVATLPTHLNSNPGALLFSCAGALLSAPSNTGQANVA
jgi:hypothetical protein